ncbi:permease-like cell division protein FtsX [Specibacter cremeus]|uniref:permease-like cell division protein FtsX n=1 Tax=Specibacter cremeus TaxID=1629051 RepID=UPI000F775EA1|nr:permease-like cell division protein FtsX [Specibacter cremeus]
MRLAFILSEIGGGLRRNLSMVISVVLVTCVSLTFVGTAALLQMQITQMKGFWYDKVQVAIFLCSDTSNAPNCASGPATAEQKAGIQTLLNSAAVKPYIKSSVFESQADALKHFREQFANSPIKDTVTADQLPSSFRISLVDPQKYQIINETFSATPGVDSVIDQRKLLESLFTFMNAASVVAIGIAALMIVCAVLLIATTIRLSAQSRQREIGIMRLVGASKTVIQLPFVLEGVIAAAVGALLASAAVWAIATFFVQGFLAGQFKDTPFIAANQALYIGPLLLILGVALAAISSSVSLRRHLKV